MFKMNVQNEFLIDFVDCWLHLSIAQASLALRSVCAAIPNYLIETSPSPS